MQALRSDRKLLIGREMSLRSWWSWVENCQRCKPLSLHKYSRKMTHIFCSLFQRNKPSTRRDQFSIKNQLEWSSLPLRNKELWELLIKFMIQGMVTSEEAAVEGVAEFPQHILVQVVIALFMVHRCSGIQSRLSNSHLLNLCLLKATVKCRNNKIWRIRFSISMPITRLWNASSLTKVSFSIINTPTWSVGHFVLITKNIRELILILLLRQKLSI